MTMEGLRTLLPAKVSSLSVSAGSLVLFDHQTIGRPAGLGSTWIYLCSWRCFLCGDSVYSSDDCYSDGAIVAGFSGLMVGRSLIDISTDIDNSALKLVFDDGVAIVLSDGGHARDDDWLIFFLTNGDKVSFSPALGFYVER